MHVNKSMNYFFKSLMASAIVASTMPNYASAPLTSKHVRLPADVLTSLTDSVLSHAEAAPNSTEIPEDWSLETLEPIERTDALNDPKNRVSPEFKVPEVLKNRTAFWFDIYTKYGSSHHVVHHVRYPWIVFKVIDTSSIENNPKLHKWTKYHRAKALVRNEVAAVRRTLKKLANRKSYKNLKGLEKELFDSVKSLSGSRRSVFRMASHNVRSQLGQKDFFLSGLQHSSRYLPYMEKEFREAGLPTELTRIPFVESSFNPAAESKVGASGIWQIMPRVGRAYVIVNDHIDERNAPLKASLVALDLMKRNYKSLQDWPLAVTAYNHGAGGVRKALRASKSKTLDQIISRYHRGSFKFASSNFFTSFLAVLHAEKYHREIFKDLSLDRQPLIQYSVYQLKKRTRAKQLTKMIGIEHDQFLKYNLDLKDALKKNAWVPKDFRILVPREQRFQIDAKARLNLRPVREAANNTASKKPGKS